MRFLSLSVKSTDDQISTTAQEVVCLKKSHVSVGLKMLYLTITYLDTLSRSLGKPCYAAGSLKQRSSILLPLLEEFEGLTLNLEVISMDASIAAVLSTSDGIFNLAK